MKKTLKFYQCSHCKNMIHMISDSGVPVMCCGQPMQELIPNTMDAAQEKHVPVVTRSGHTLKVEVGSVAHPMMEAHYIEWIYVETESNTYMRLLNPEEAPAAEFEIGDQTVKKVYAYCNLHGLWQATLE